MKRLLAGLERRGGRRRGFVVGVGGVGGVGEGGEGGVGSVAAGKVETRYSRRPPVRSKQHGNEHRMLPPTILRDTSFNSRQSNVENPLISDKATDLRSR